MKAKEIREVSGGREEAEGAVGRGTAERGGREGGGSDLMSRRRSPWLQGSFVALVTPFRGEAGREVDEEALRALVRWHLEEGTDGLVPCGTTGEAATMEAEEFAQVVRVVRQEVDRAGRSWKGGDYRAAMGEGSAGGAGDAGSTGSTGTAGSAGSAGDMGSTGSAGSAGSAGREGRGGRGGRGEKNAKKPVLVVAGTGTNSTRASIERTRLAKEMGADAALVVTPYYNKPTQEGLYRHYRAVAEQGGLPVVVYNVPGRTASNILPETVARLVKDVEEIVAVKEASGNLGQITDLIGRVGEEIAVLSGDDGLNMPIAMIGGAGGISVLGNVVPGDNARLFRAVREGDVKTARRLHHKYFNLVNALFVETNPIPVKTALAMMGKLNAAVFRLPLCEMSEAGRQVLRKALAEVGLV